MSKELKRVEKRSVFQFEVRSPDASPLRAGMCATIWSSPALRDALLHRPAQWSAVVLPSVEPRKISTKVSRNPSRKASSTLPCLATAAIAAVPCNKAWQKLPARQLVTDS